MQEAARLDGSARGPASVVAWEVDADEPVTSVLLECRRPGFARSQVFRFTLEWPLTDGALKDGFVSTAVEPEQVEKEFLGPVRAEGIEPAEIRPAAAIELVAAGAARCAAAELGSADGALLPLTLLLRAGKGEEGAAPGAQAQPPPLASGRRRAATSLDGRARRDNA